MKTAILISCVVIALNLQAQNTQTARTTHPPDEVIPLIVMDSVPFHDAVKNLARQGQINYILDIRVLASFAGPGGESAREPMITRRWEKVTAGQALNDLLVDQKMKLVTNTATGVARIMFAKDEVKTPGTNQAESGTGAMIPLIVMDQVPLRDAIVNLARQAEVQVELDPKLDAPGSGLGGKALSRAEVSIRWQNITARQALDALLENYGLVLVKGTGGTGAWMVTRAAAGAGK